jgi:magnesium transporter
MQISIFEAQGLRKTEYTHHDLAALRQSQQVLWIDIIDPTDDELDKLKHTFGLHPLAVEDMCNEYQRPKVEEYQDHLFLISNTLQYHEHVLEFREIDIFLGKNYLITAHEAAEPVIEEVKRRLETGGPARLVSSEYLLYVVLDTVVDAYFPTLDRIGDDIERLSEEVLEHPRRTMLRQLFELRRGLNKAWYIVGQHRDMFSILTRRAEDLITHHAVLEYYLRDVNDHLIRIGDITAVQRDNLHNIIDLYVSAQSNRLNIVVNRLAIITILIGILTVISGFYGMNFEHTWPPFSAPWGVPFVLAVMLGLVAGVMALFKWLDLY